MVQRDVEPPGTIKYGVIELVYVFVIIELEPGAVVVVVVLVYFVEKEQVDAPPRKLPVACKIFVLLGFATKVGITPPLNVAGRLGATKLQLLPIVEIFP